MMRVKTVLALAVVAALAVAAAEPAASEDAAISPGFRIACVVTFPTPPRGRTTLVGKDREYLLRYDREEDADECPSATFSLRRNESFARCRRRAGGLPPSSRLPGSSPKRTALRSVSVGLRPRSGSLREEGRSFVTHGILFARPLASEDSDRLCSTS